MDKQENFLIESEQAAVMKDAYPKAQYHFLVVAKENIDNVTALTREHLPLLDHMMELANQIIERQQHLPSSDFLVGFKIDAFMNRLTMHVISNDFYSVSMKRKTHWNSFNTDLFLTYQAVYALLRIRGSIDKLPKDKVHDLRKAEQLHCNQCDFESNSLLALKAHLFQHWKKREDDFELKKQVDKITNMLDESKLAVESEKEKSQTDEQPKPIPVTTNWRQNPNRNPSNIKNEPKEQPKNWRQNSNQPPPVEQPSVPYPNSFAKHFQKSVDRQNQRNQIVSPMQGQGLMGPSPFIAPGQLMSQPNQALYNFQLLPNGTNQGPPFMPRHRMWIPNNNINQIPQSTDSPPLFNPFRQPPNMGQFQSNRYNGPSTFQVHNNPTNESNIRPNWRPRTQPNQNTNKSKLNRDNSTTMKTQPNRTKPNWKPSPPNSTSVNSQPNGTLENKPNGKPQLNQDQIKSNNGNSTPLNTQPNQAKENKPKWKPKTQHNQGQNRSLNKPNYKPNTPTQNVAAKQTQPANQN
ncbi:hypothetical protein ACLKA7_008793 [Drosophila subpalustris]